MFRRVGCALVAGLLLWSAFPSLGWWPGAVIGVALLAHATAGARSAQGLALGMLAGWAYFGPLLSWSGIYVGKLPWFALATLEGLYTAGLGGVLAFLQRGRVRPFAVALTWVTSEYLRGHTPFGGFPWGRLAFSQADSPFAHLASLAGAPGVTFGVALTGGLLAAGIARATGPGSRRALPALTALAGAIALPLGAWAVPLPSTTGEGTARITAIQGNVPQAGLDFNAQRRAVLDNHAAVTRDAAQELRRAGEPRPDLVIWPENASDIDPLRNAGAAQVIRAAVAAIGAPTIVGAVLAEPADHVSNTSLLYQPDGRVTDRYDKQRPVPFAEYIPYRPFFRLFSDKVDLVVRDFAAGTRTGVFRVPSAAGGQIAVGLNICFEVAIDDVVRGGVVDGANLISIQTNNATFGFTDESVQQLAISRIRAIEHGRSVVHISNVGVSALITPDGTAHQSTSLFTAAVLSGDLPLRSALTPATRVGPLPEWLAGVALVALLAFRLFGGRRTRSTSSGLVAGVDPRSPTVTCLEGS